MGEPRGRAGVIALLVLLALALAAAWAQRTPGERVSEFAARDPVNIAHAGAQGHAPENTLPAFERALELGADALEMDLQRTGDGEVVVLHDGTVDRTTDGTGAVDELTLDEVRELDAGHEFRGPEGGRPFRGQGVRIPTLEEVFADFPETFLVLELKTESGQGLVDDVAELVREHDREHTVAISSFDLRYVRRARALLPETPTNMPEGEARAFHILQLLGVDRWWSPPGELLQVPVEFEGQRVITPGFLRAAERHGIDVHAWTVNEPEHLHRLLNIGIHGVLTDYPDRLEEVRAARVAAAEQRADPGRYPGLGTVQEVQERAAWLTTPSRVLTVLGDEEFYVVVFPAVLWSVHYGAGLFIGFALLLSSALNAIAKLIAHAPRPGFLDPSVALVAEPSFGLPSGHAQNAVAVWGAAAAQLQRWWAWAGAAVLAAAIGLSRILIGAHFPLDVVAGWGIGLVVLGGLVGLRGPGRAWIQRQESLRLLRVAIAVAFVLLVAAVAARLALLSWEAPASWIGMLPRDHPAQLSTAINAAAAAFGLAAGAVFLRNRGGFSAAGPWWQRALRYPLGLLGMLALWYGLGEAFPAGEDPVALVFRVLRYVLIGAWAGGGAPWVFLRLRLARPPASE